MASTLVADPQTVNNAYCGMFALLNNQNFQSGLVFGARCYEEEFDHPLTEDEIVLLLQQSVLSARNTGEIIKGMALVLGAIGCSIA